MKLTDIEKRQIDEMPTIGYWSALGGIELKKVEHGIEDYAICTVGAWQGNPTYHRVKIKYTRPKHIEPKAYIVIRFQMFYLNDCILSLF